MSVEQLRREMGLETKQLDATRCLTSSSAATWSSGSKPTARLALRVLELVEAVIRDPFQGIGKPEPLKHDLAGCWSRRITPEHRLVYRVRQHPNRFLQARYHY